MYKPTPEVRSYGTDVPVPNYARGNSSQVVSPLDSAYAAAEQALQQSDTPLYGFEQYTPYDYAKRYMTGRGHTGYIGMQSSEDYNAQRESNWIKATNGIMKGLGVAGTSFIDGTLGTIVGLGNWMSTGEFSKFFDNPVTNAMEDFRRLTEEWAPNYYTDVERNAEWYSMDNWMKTNFLFDKLIKNAGFAAAAIGEGALVARLLQGLKRGTTLGKLPQMVDELEYGLSAVNRGERATDAFKGFGGNWLKSYLEKPIAGMTDIESLSTRAAKVEKASNNVINKAASILATTAEANAEALQGTRRLREELIASYKEANNGVFPSGEDLKEIEERAADGGSIRFGMNVLTLGISNMIQFPRLLNGSLSAEKGAIAKEIREVAVDKTGASTAKAGENYVTKAALASGKQKALRTAAKSLGVIELSEGAEEGMQYAIEEGIHEYQMMAQDPRAVNAIKNIFTEGLGKTFSSKEGMESIMLGVLTGGLMNKVTNFGKGSKINRNTQDFLKDVNSKPQAGAFVATYDGENDSYSAEMLRSVARGFTAQQEKEQGHIEGDMVKVKDADAKAFISYALPRIKYGRFDLLQDELDQYATRPFEEVKAELGLPDNVTPEEVSKRVASLKEKATIIKNLYDSMSMRFGQQAVKKDGKVVSKYTPEQIDGLVYHAFRVADYERRYNNLFAEVNVGLSKANYQGKFTLEALFDKSLRKDDNNKEVDLERIRTQMYKQLNSIPAHLQQDKDGVSYAEKLRDLERVQNKREDYLYHFEDLKTQDVMDLDAFDVENASVEDYLKYERQSKNKTVLRQLEKNTERRPDTKNLMDFVTTKLKEGLNSQEIVSAIKAENTFVYDGTKEAVLAQNVNESNILEEAIQQYSDYLDTLDPTDMDDIGIMAETQEKMQNIQKALDSLMADRETIPTFEDEPFIGNDNSIKRALANSFVDKADVFLTAAAKDPDYGDEKTVSAISKVIAELKKLKSIFSDRKDNISETKEFKGFEDKLKSAISELEDLNQQIKERIADREAIQKQAVEDYGEVRSMASGFDVRNQKVISQRLYDLFKSLVGEQQLTELLKKLTDSKSLHYADILVDFVNQKATNEQKEQFLAAIEDEMKDLAARITATEFATEFKKGAVGNKRENMKRMLENPGAFIHAIMSEVSYNFRDKTDNPFGRYLIKHGNTRQLQKDLETTGGEYNYVKASTPEFLELYHQYKSLFDFRQVIQSSQTQYDIYARLEKQVKDDMAANRPVPTQQQMLAIRETITSLFNSTPLSKAYDGWIYLEGVIGAGKTSVFGRYVLDAYKGILSKQGVTKDLNELVQGTADLQTTAENLTGALGLSSAKSIDTVITELKNGTFAQDLLIVDEFARVGMSKATELSNAVAEFNSSKDKQVRVLAIGDQAQIRDIAFISSLPTNVIHVYPLTISYRSSVNAIADIQQRFKGKGTDVTQGIVTESNFANPKEAGEEKLYGVNGSTSMDQMLDVIASRPASVSKVIIVDDGTLAAVSQKVAQSGIQVPIVTAREAQGKTWDEVYLWMAPEPGAAPLDFNTRMYTSARGRNFVYLGGINVKTNENKQILSGIAKNDTDNTNRAKSTSIFLNDALDEFERYFGVDPRTVNIPGVTTIAEQQSEIKAEAQIKHEQVEDELEDVGDAPAITPTETKVEVPVEKNTVVVNNPVPEGSSVVQIRSPFFGGLKRNAGFSEDQRTHEFRVVPVIRQDATGEQFVQMYLMREYNGRFYEIAVIGNRGTNPEIDQFPEIKKAWERATDLLKSKKGNVTVQFDETSQRGEFILKSTRDSLEQYTVARGRIVTAKSVGYNYSNAANGPLRFGDIVRKWYSDFFASPDNTVKPAADADTTVRGARIVTLNSKEADEINNKLSNRLVKPGFTYIEITDTNQEGWLKKGTPQYIELKGRVLNNDVSNRQNLVHFHKIINPMRKFIGKVKAFDTMLQPFLSNPEVRLMTGGDIQLGSHMYNLMIRELSDNNWETNRKKTSDRKINVQIEEIEQKRKDEILAGGSPVEINRRYDAEILTLLENTEESYAAEEKAFLDRLFDFLKTNQVEKAKVVEAAREIDELVYGRQRYENMQKVFFYEKEGQRVTVSQKDIDSKNEKFQEWVAAYGNARKAFKQGWEPRTKKDMDGNIVPIYGSRANSVGVIQRVMNKLAQANRLVRTPKGEIYFRTQKNIKGKTILSAKTLLELSSKDRSSFNYSEARLMETLLSEMGILDKYPMGLSVNIQGRDYLFNLPLENGVRVRDNVEPIRYEDLQALNERKDQIKMGPITLSDLETMFGDEAFDGNGNNTSSLRANIPIGQDWKNGEELTDEAGNPVLDDQNKQIVLSSEELQQNYLETEFISVSPTQLSVTMDGVSAPEETKTDKIAPPPPKKVDPFKRLFKGPGGAAPLLKSKFDGSGQRVPVANLMDYVRKFIPGITDAEVQVMDPLAMMRLESVHGLQDTWGMFVDKVIYLLSDRKNGIYKQVVRHEIFHKIFRNFLTTAERAEIINDAREQFDWKGPNYKTDYQIEEELADIFGNRNDRSGSLISDLATSIKQFFRKIGTILGLVKKQRHRIETLFELIESGAFQQPSVEPKFGAAAKRKFKLHYNNDFDLANRVESLWHAYLAYYNSPKFVDEDGQRDDNTPKVLREIKASFVEELKLKKEELENEGLSLSVEEARYLQAINVVLTQRNGKYVVLNDMIKELYPKSASWEYLNDEEFVNDEDMVATLDDIINKDDNVDFHSKLTDNVKRFLGSLFVDVQGQAVPIRVSNALAKLYKTLTNFDTSDYKTFADNVRAAFEVEHDVKQVGDVWEGNQYTATIAKSLLDLIDQANREYSQHIKGPNGDVYLDPNVFFKDENTFVFFGQEIKRTGSEEMIMLEKKLAVAETEVEKEQIEAEIEGKTFRIESTDDFFSRIIREVGDIDRQTGERSFISEASIYDSFFLLKEVWARDMAQDTLQDMMNLINSGYDVQPRIAMKQGYKGSKSFSYLRIGSNRTVSSYKDTIDTALRHAVSSDKWDEIAKISESVKSALSSGNPKEQNRAINKFLIDLGIISSARPISISPSKQKTALEAIDRILSGMSEKDSTESFDKHLLNMSNSLRVIVKLVDNSDNAQTQASYTDGEGKKRFFQRYIDFAQRTAINLMRKADNVYKVSLDAFMNPTQQFKEFTKLYALNYFNADSKINRIFDYGLHDSIKEDWRDNAIQFSDETDVEFMERNFFSQFMGKINENKPLNQNYITYAQQPYTISNKTYIKTYEVGVLGTSKKGQIGTIREAIKASIVQEFYRPDPTNEKFTIVRNGQKINPLDIKNYNSKKANTSQLAGITGDTAVFWKQMRDAVQAGKPVTDDQYNTLINAVEAAMEQKADEFLAQMNGNQNVSQLDAMFVKRTYEELLQKGVLTKKDIPADVATVKTGQEITLELNEYNAAEPKFLRPLVQLWYKNFYLNGLMLNQITVGDQAMFKNEYDEIKRMSIFHGIGQSMMIGPRYAKSKFRVIVGEDIKSLFNSEKVKTDYMFQQSLEEAKVNEMMKEINWTDGQGLMGMRRFEDLQKGYGPGANLQNTLKPVYAGIDQFGVNRTLKYSSVVITDELARKFPLLRELRVKMELNGLKGKDWTRGRELLNKKIDKGNLSILETKELREIFAKNEDLYIDEFVADSAIKTGIPNGKLSFDRTTGRYEGFSMNETMLPETAIIDMDNRNWRIQINPAHDIDSNVSLFTQLMYFANFDGRNPQEANSMYSALGSLFQIGINEMREALGITNVTDVAGRKPKQLEKPLREMLKKKMGSMPGKEKAHEFLEHNVSLNAPFMVNDMVTQLASMFNKTIIRPKFNGSKFVLQSAMLTHDVYSNGKISADLVPKFDAENNIMEVYLPNIFKKFLPEEYRGKTDAELMEMFDKGEVVFNNTMMLGFRIPSTGINSAVRIRVKGLYPSENNIIIAPPNITFQHGSDYDVDSLFIVRATTYTKSEAEAMRKAGIEVKEGQAIGLDENYSSAFQKKLENSPELSSVLKGFLKNKIVDTYLNLLAKAENQSDILKPITFDIPKNPNRWDSLFNLAAYYSPDASVAELVAELRPLVDKVREKTATAQDIDRLDALREQILFTRRDINDPADLMKMQLDNKSGTKLTGIAANSAKGVAYLLNATTDGQLPKLKDNLHFTIDGVTYDGISRVDRGEGGGTQVSEHFSWMVNAAIDNVKEQILQVINMSIGMGNLWLGFTALGMRPAHTLMLLKQPFVQPLVNLNRIKDDHVNAVKADIIGKLNAFDTEVTGVELKQADLQKFASMTADAIGKLPKEEQIHALKVQYSVMDVIGKGIKIGNSLFATTRALSILQNDRATYEEQMDIMDSIFDIYESEEEAVVSGEASPFATTASYKKHSFLPERPLSAKYAFENVDLFKLPHWAKAYDQFKLLMDLEKAAFFKHSKKMQELTLLVKNHFSLTGNRNSLFSFRQNEDNRMIRDELIKYFFTGLKFSQFGRSVDFNSAEEVYTVTNRNKSTTLYGAEAFIQRFIDKVQMLKTHPDYSSNEFLKKIRITRDFRGIQRMSMSDMSAMTYIDIKMLENEFVKLGEADREIYRSQLEKEISENVQALEEDREAALAEASTEAERMEIESRYSKKIHFENKRLDNKWFSELQTDFVKYLVLAEGLRFSGSTFATILPAEIYLPVFKAFDKALDNIANRPMDELSKVIEHFGLSMLLNKADDMKNGGRGLKVDYTTGSAKVEKIGGKEIFYNLKLTGTPDVPLKKDQAPLVIKKAVKPYSENPNADLPSTDYVFVRMAVSSAEHEAYYALAGKANTHETYNFRWDLLTDTYRLADHFKPNLINLVSSDVVIETKKFKKQELHTPVLYYAKEVPNGTIVSVAKPSDPTRIYANQYQVVQKVKEAASDEVRKELKAKADEVRAQKNAIRVTDREVRILEAGVESLKKTIDSKEKVSPSKLKELEDKQAQLELKRKQFQEKVKLDEDLQALFDQMKEAKFKYELMEIKSEMSPSVVQLSADDARMLYNRTANFDPSWTDEEVLLYHDQVMSGKILC